MTICYSLQHNNKQAPVQNQQTLKYKDVLSEYMSHTAIHGIPVLAGHLGVIKRLIWTLAVVGCLSGMVYSLYAITNLYLSYPVYVRIEKLHSKELKFPAITVCNTNPVKMSSVVNNPQIQSLFASWGFDVTAVKRRKKRATCSYTDTTNNICYWRSATFTPNKATAASACVSEGGQLAVLDTMSIDQNVRATNFINTGSPVWLDLEYVSGQWKWQGTTTATHQGWNVNPGVPTSQFCVITHSAGWSTCECSGNIMCFLPGLCQLSTSTTTTLSPTTMTTTTTASTTTTAASTTTAATSTASTAVSTKTAVTTSSTLSTAVSTKTTVTTTSSTLSTAVSTKTAVTTTSSTLSTAVASTSVITTSFGSGYPSLYPEKEPYREDFLKENDLITLMSILTVEERKQLGYNFPEFILNCAYGDQICHENQFEYVFDAVHGNCYIFNSGWNETLTFFNSSRSGPRYGLSLLVNVKQEEYISDIGQNAGAVVIVADQNVMPFPEDQGILAKPGMSTSIGIKKVMVSQLGDQYSDCTDETQANNMFASHYQVKYTVMSCEKTCYQHNVIDRCGCADPQYPLNGSIPCNLRNTTQDDCMYGVMLLYRDNRLDCNCPNPCVQEYYTHSVSRVLWPVDKSEDMIIENYRSRLNDTISHTQDPTFFRRNLLKIVVYFDELNWKSLQELPKYTLTRFISDIGATIGLWFGCSLFTLLELFELVVDILVLAVMKCMGKMRGPSEPTTATNQIPSSKSKSRRIQVKAKVSDSSIFMTSGV